MQYSAASGQSPGWNSASVEIDLTGSRRALRPVDASKSA